MNGASASPAPFASRRPSSVTAPSRASRPPPRAAAPASTITTTITAETAAAAAAATLSVESHRAAARPARPANPARPARPARPAAAAAMVVVRAAAVAAATSPPSTWVGPAQPSVGRLGRSPAWAARASITIARRRLASVGATRSLRISTATTAAANREARRLAWCPRIPCVGRTYAHPPPAHPPALSRRRRAHTRAGAHGHSS